MFSITIRNLAAQKLRTAASAVAVLLGVAFVAGTFVLADTTRAALNATYADSYAGIDAYVRAERAFGSWRGDRRPRLSATLVDKLAGVAGVAGAEGRVEGYAQLVDRRGRGLGNADDTRGANWPELERSNPFRLVAGRAPRNGDEVVIDRGSATRAGYRVGDRAPLVTKLGRREMSVVGIAAFGRADSPGGTPYVLFHRDTAQRLLAEPGRVDAIAVVAAAGTASQQVRDRVAAAAGGGVEVLTNAQLVEERRSGEVQAMTAAIRTFLLAFAAVALFVGALIIYNTFSILVAQRSKEVALLRLVGATRRQVVVAVLGEAVVVGLAGSALGAVVGIGVAAALRGAVGVIGVAVPGGGVVVTAPAMLVAVAAGVAVTVAAAALPALRAASVPPIAALRQVAVDSSGRSRRRATLAAVLAIAGAVVLVAGLRDEQVLPIGLGGALVFLAIATLGPLVAPPVVRALGAPLRRLAGAPAALATESARRNPRRTSGAAAALMIGIGLMTLLSTVAATAKAAVSQSASEPERGAPQADFAIHMTSHVAGGISPELARRVAQLPQIAEVATSRMAVARVDGDASLDLVALDATRWQAVGADLGVVQGSLADLVGDTIAVQEAMARRKGWSIGDVIPVRFADTGERRLRLVATTTFAASYIVSLSTFEANVADQFDATVLAKLRDGVRRQDVRPAVAALVAEYPSANLVDSTTAGVAQADAIDQFANMVYVLLAVAVVIALVGIANTLALAVLERTRELGLLRAVGMTRRQLRAMVLWEAVVTAVLGAALGVAVGLSFAWAALQALPDTAGVQLQVPVVRLVAVTLVATVAALLAAAAPAHRAAKLDALTAVAAP